MGVNVGEYIEALLALPSHFRELSLEEFRRLSCEMGGRLYAVNPHNQCVVVWDRGSWKDPGVAERERVPRGAFWVFSGGSSMR